MTLVDFHNDDEAGQQHVDPITEAVPLPPEFMPFADGASFVISTKSGRHFGVRVVQLQVPL